MEIFKMKRLFDILCVLGGLPILSPIFIVIAVLIKIDSKGPVYFRQERVGMNGVLFRIFKFRTMVVDAEKLGLKITVGGDARITNVGFFLRKYKLDELPQLFNVLFGEMSLVGPRPEVSEYVAYYSEDERKIIQSVRPGITDLASLEFRDENEMLRDAVNPKDVYIHEILPKKIAYYIEYVTRQNLMLDIKIILRTLAAIVR